MSKFHTDNGRFSEESFVTDISAKNQGITFCGVGSHHQNGIAEENISEIVELARSMLAHGMYLWPYHIKMELWPFGLKASERVHNDFVLDFSGHFHNKKFTPISTHQDIKDEHPLFCPVYALVCLFQGSLGGLSKWEPWSFLRIYLGHSPDHASNVALVLDPRTKLVSPQYHVVFDDAFLTIDHLKNNTTPPN